MLGKAGGGIIETVDLEVLGASENECSGRTWWCRRSYGLAVAVHGGSTERSSAPTMDDNDICQAWLVRFA
jgi:hypothetical protein